MKIKRFCLVILLVLMAAKGDQCGLTGCSTFNFPKTTLMGVPVGGGSSYCIALSSLVGALTGGVLGGFLGSGQGATGTSAVQWATISTAGGAALGGVTGYSMCGPAPAPVPAAQEVAGR